MNFATAEKETLGERQEPDAPSEELKAQLTAGWREAIAKFFEPDLEASTVS